MHCIALPAPWLLAAGRRLPTGRGRNSSECKCLPPTARPFYLGFCCICECYPAMGQGRIGRPETRDGEIGGSFGMSRADCSEGHNTRLI